MGTSVSAIIQVTTAAAGVAPGPVTGLVVSGTTTTGTILTWVAPATGTVPFTYQVQQNGASVGGTTQNLTETISGLSPGTLYTFQVLVTNSTGNNSSGTISVTTLSVLPGAPTGLAVVGSPGSNNVNLSWTAPTVGTPPLTYQVSLRTPSGSGSFVPGPTSSTTSVAVTGLTSGVSYDFEVAAVNAAGTGPVSAVLANVQTTPTSVLPSAPQNPTTGTITTTTVQVGWTTPSTGTTPFSYVLQWALHGTTTFTSLSPTSSLTNTVTGLTANTSYDFQVFATNVAGTGPNSVVVSATTSAQNVVAPTAPTALTDTAVGTTTVNLQWIAPATGTQPITYQPQWSPHGLNTFTNGPTVQTTQAQITGLTANTSYDFQVAASNSGGSSPTSAIFTISTLPASTSVTFATPSTNVTLSANKLTATSTGSSTPYASPGGVTSTTSQTAGKWAVQFTLSTITQNLAIGLCNNSYTTASGYLGADTNGIGLYPSTGPGSQAALTVFYNSVLVNGPPSPLSGDTNGALVTMLLNMDLTPPQVWFQTPAMVAAFGAGSYNNLSSANANPAGSPPTGGITISVVGALFFVFSASEGGDVVVANGGTSPFSGTGVPSIFNPWGGGAPVVTIPGQVTGLVAGTPTSSSVPLAWSVPSGTAPFSYNVVFRVHNVGSFLTFGTTNNVAAATVTGLTAGTQYDFQVSASNAAGTGGVSGTVTVTTSTATVAPGAPTGVQASQPTTSSMVVSWTQPSGSTPITYLVQYRVTGTTAWSNAAVPISSPDPTVITTIGPTFTDNQGNVWSLGVSSTSGNAVYLNGAQDTTTYSVAQLVWTAQTIWQVNTSGNVFSKTAASGVWALQASLPTLPTTPGYSEAITGLAAGTSYDFQVQATNGVGSGPFSSPVVTASTVSAQSGQFTVSLPSAPSGQILDPSGNIFVPRGVDITASGDPNQGQVSAGATLALNNGGPQAIMTAFPHGNFVRCLVSAAAPPIPGPPPGGNNNHNYFETFAYLNTYIPTLTAAGYVVMLEYFIYGYSIGPGTIETSYYTNAFASYAAGFANNPMVWYCSQNEPQEDGGNWEFMVALTYATVRGNGATAPICNEAPGGQLSNAQNPTILINNATFTGSISGTTLTVTSNPSPNNIVVGQSLTGANIPPATVITGGPGGIIYGSSGGTGTYTINKSLNVASQSMTASFINVFWQLHLYQNSPGGGDGTVQGNLNVWASWMAGFRSVTGNMPVCCLEYGDSTTGGGNSINPVEGGGLIDPNWQSCVQAHGVWTNTHVDEGNSAWGILGPNGQGDNLVADAAGQTLTGYGALVQSYMNGSTITASISGSTLTVTSLNSGSVMKGQKLTGTGVPAGTVISQYGTGRGGPGNYTISTTATVASRAMSTGW